MTKHTIINIQQIRDDICKRKAMPPFGPDTSINRLKTINETQRSFTLEVVELLLGEIDVLSKSEWTLADELVKAQKRITELEAMRELFLRAKALMYQSGGAPIENSLNPIDAWLYDAELTAAGIGVKGG
ncbi:MULTISPECIES: hypothetical protein [Citrobacter]|uniref:hypothetical protein n=1 Tax=Citrobacter TaxID=544 RepID=UPI001D0AC69C|nr:MULTISPECIES: hypothetical protein [Citrobacter]MCC0139476.1 hypothetical protein [Citrobacter freundii]MDK7601645.1 hypothetical protein [Citrobacter freundii]MDM3323020.1 hypothetical protein [Citrobacter sp. Cb080]UEK69942.1 hypothetical protein LMH92_05525 [Citrobacter freundii]